MIRVGQTPLDHFFGDHEGKVGRLRADFLNRLSAFMLDFASCIALDPLRLGRQPLFIFFHELLGGGLGWVVDTYLLETGPWGLVFGLILGAAAGVRNAYRMAQRWPR